VVLLARFRDRIVYRRRSVAASQLYTTNFVQPQRLLALLTLLYVFCYASLIEAHVAERANTSILKDSYMIHAACCAWQRHTFLSTRSLSAVQRSSLFQNAVVLYTDKVITMSFKAASLAQDLQNFRLYVQYSSFASSADKNAYVYNLVREKMHSAVPNCLVTAQTKYQLSLDDTLPFEAFLDDCYEHCVRQYAQQICVRLPRRHSDLLQD
jgi:hypothetical protein